MPIFLDTGKLDEIKKYHNLGVIRGVTTNPTILLKDGIQGNIDKIKERAVLIAKLIQPYPLSVEVTSNNKEEMLKQAQEFSSWAENINVKITIHGPDGELDNLEVVNLLENKFNVRVNVTAMMSAQQCLLAAMAGATYVSLFGGRVNNMGYNSIEEIKKASFLIQKYKLKSKLIIGSTREVLNIIEWLAAGADIVTATPDFIEKMIVHPYSKETVKQFLDDAKK